MQCYKCRKYFQKKQESWNICKKAIKLNFGNLLMISTFQTFISKKSLTGLILAQILGPLMSQKELKMQKM